LPSYFVSALTVACALFMENLDSTVISTSLPEIAREIHENPISLKLALTSYLFSLAIFIPASGWAADHFGARNIFRLAIIVFTLGSISCGFSSDLPELVAARAVQGLGGAMMVPVGRLVLLRSVEQSEIVNALSWLTVPALLGPLAGPLLGGFITTYFHWRWIFWINVPIGIIGLILATAFIEETGEKVFWPFDILGFFLCGFGLALVLFGLGGAGRGLVPWQIALLMGSAGLFALGLYAFHARRTQFPLIDLDLLRVKTFQTSVTGGSLFRIGIGAIPFLLPLMLQTSFAMNPFQSGSVTFIASVGAMAMKGTAAPILRTFGFRRVLVYNAVLSSAFFACYGLFTPATPLAYMMGFLLVSGFIRSLEFTALNAIAFADIPPDKMSRAVSFSAVAQQLSLSVGIAAGAGALQGFALLDPSRDAFALEHFRFAFMTTAAISLTGALAFIRLPWGAGANLVRRHVASETPAVVPGE